MQEENAFRRETERAELTPGGRYPYLDSHTIENLFKIAESLSPEMLLDFDVCWTKSAYKGSYKRTTFPTRVAIFRRILSRTEIESGIYTYPIGYPDWLDH